MENIERRLGVESQAAYDALAPFYEQHWGTQFFSSAKQLFLDLIHHQLRAEPSVLDLCCGTGEFAAWLAEMGIPATGLDSSSLMIDRARLNVPGAEFIRADMAAFALPQRFDAITCFFNSINQVLTVHTLRGVLRSVNQHLKPGGWFLFDGIDEEGYLESWHADEVIHRDNQVCTLRYRYDRYRQLAICHVNIAGLVSEPDCDFELRQRPYVRNELSQELAAAGFSVELVRPVNDSYPVRGRYVILARSKGGTGERPEH